MVSNSPKSEGDVYTIQNTIDYSDYSINKINLFAINQVVSNKTHSHSMVAGGFPEMSYTTRLMPRTSLMMRLETFPSNS